MTEPFPTEIWVQILAHLHFTSLHSIKHVDRTLYRLCREILCSVLDMTMNVKNQDSDELEILTKRLQDAKTHTQRVKKLRLSPAQVNIREFEDPTPPMAQPKPKGLSLRKRLFQRWKDPVQLAPGVPPGTHIRRALDKANNLEGEISSLIPLLSSLQELDFHQLSDWEGGWYSIFNIALTVASTQLTVLSLHFSLVNGPSSTIYGTNCTMFSITLPALHTLRLGWNTTPPTDFESSIRKLVAGSPLLRELEYRIKEDIDTLHAPSHVTQLTPTHSHLKVFKWIAGPLAPTSSLFTAHASQFEIVHLNPVPFLGVVQRLAIDKLIELRVDLYSSSDISQFFSLLAHATQLVTLEITRWVYGTVYYLLPHLLLRMNLVQLKSLYLGIPLWILSREILRALASMAPNLFTLAILIETSENARKANRLLLENGSSFISDISASKMLPWKLRDFGIIILEPGKVGISPILPLIPLLRIISLKIPSITSFYGTGRLDLWEGMQSEIDESWSGELWRERYRKQ
ncbi:hypothetical protein DL96DRAFT_1686458 [Flagelloscypha sp. PMI_526]|nr:hypothetical protein DL96DRAFT_1686458 [Flagelloscypha sp. PMI_526]